MAGKNIIVVDVGTQSLRTSIVSEDGKIVAFEREIYQSEVITAGTAKFEQWPDYYWERLCKALRRLTANPLFAASAPIGLVCCDFRDTACYLDADLKPVRPSILWLDSRTAKLPGDRYLSRIDRALFSLVGMMDTARANARRTPAHWLRENEPENWAKVAKYVPLGAYLNLKMTGQLCVSTADCIGHYPMHFSKGEWYTHKNMRWGIFGLKESQLCDLVPVGSKLGSISRECAQATGLPEGLPVYASASDKACEVMGNGCLSPEVATISLGTACTVDQVVDFYRDSEPFLPAYRAPVAGYYDMEIQIYRGFWMLKWFADNFTSDDELAVARGENIPVEAVFDRYLDSVEPGSGGLLVQPYWGAGLSRPNARGAMIGFSDADDRRHIYRALVEGITYALREGLETLEKRSHRCVGRLIISGGGSRSHAIQRIVADVFNLPVTRAGTTESCTLGAALGGFVACGVHPDAATAVQRMIRLGETIQPDVHNAAIYERYFQVYREIYPSLNHVYTQLKHLTNSEPKEDER